MANQPQKCAHTGCNCMAPAGEKFCSTLCADATGTTTLKCDCGHSGCERASL